MSRDQKCENEPSTRPERSAPEREIFEEQKRKPVWPKDLKCVKGRSGGKRKIMYGRPNGQGRIWILFLRASSQYFPLVA